MVLTDPKGNRFYIKRDVLCVDLPALQVTRKIGKLTINLNTGTCNLILRRKPNERIKLGWLVSAFPLFNLPIDKIILIEEPNGNIYMLEWAKVKETRKHWTFNPKGGYEEQILLPDGHWSNISPNSKLIITQ